MFSTVIQCSDINSKTVISQLPVSVVPSRCWKRGIKSDFNTLKLLTERPETSLSDPVVLARGSQ